MNIDTIIEKYKEHIYIYNSLEEFNADENLKVLFEIRRGLVNFELTGLKSGNEEENTALVERYEEIEEEMIQILSAFSETISGKENLEKFAKIVTADRLVKIIKNKLDT